jgi:hypothetical protein
VYHDAVDESPSSGRPPNSPSHEEKSTDYSAASLGILMQHLTIQLDNSRLVQEQAVASLERQFVDFVQESTDHSTPLSRESSSASYANVTSRRPSSNHGATTPQGNDIQDAMHEESFRCDDVNQRTPFGDVRQQQRPVATPSTPASTFGDRR